MSVEKIHGGFFNKKIRVSDRFSSFCLHIGRRLTPVFLFLPEVRHVLHAFVEDSRTTWRIHDEDRRDHRPPPRPVVRARHGRECPVHRDRDARERQGQGALPAPHRAGPARPDQHPLPEEGAGEEGALVRLSPRPRSADGTSRSIRPSPEHRTQFEIQAREATRTHTFVFHVFSRKRGGHEKAISPLNSGHCE